LTVPAELAAGLKALGAVARTGFLRPGRPDRMLRMVRQGRKWGPTAAAATAMSAARYPNRPAIIDERGVLTWDELDQRTTTLARRVADAGVGSGSVVGILCRNHRGFVEALVVAAKTGAGTVLLNTGFSGPQLGDVVRREGVTALVYDEVFQEEVDGAGVGEDLPRFVTWPERGSPGPPTLDALLAAGGSSEALVPPAGPGEVVVLSSGTTGTPKGARRSTSSGAGGRGSGSSGMSSSLGMITRMPLRARETTLVAAPLFHSWGLSHLMICAGLSSPMVLRERFDPEDVLASIEVHRVGTFVAVPAMLQRILDLGAGVRARYDTSSLRMVTLSGSALPGGLATRWMDAFGDNLYSLYGSTEVSAVAIADPADLRAAPDTAGPVLPGIDVRLLDDGGRPVASGSTGRIFVRSGMLFDGYTGGATKELIDGYMSTGDVGHFDHQGRLFVDGREDDMIVSGGENVFPQEVEEVILQHPAVAEAVVVGVPDVEFGQRLRAVIVAKEGIDRPSVEDLRDWVRNHLARYKVPRDVVFRSELPQNPTGKVLRRVLIEEATSSGA
jgi:acyl-CoA synthetase (AMP-forming)/AMP-acid ligase II